MLKFILLDRKLNRKLKFEVLESCVMPVLLYGCKIWTLTARLRKTLQVCQKKMSQNILGHSLKDRIPNRALQEMTATTDPAQRAMWTKWT